MQKSSFSLKQGKKPFEENDFKWISELGFNFVRLPLDYRAWIKNGDWNQLNETAFEEIDQAVAWGHKYKLHVSISFYLAPGYRVNQTQDARSIWTDEEAQNICARYWAVFAKHYKGVPNRELSFNLLNEPPDIEPSQYLRVVTKIIDAIRNEDPSRLIIVDGINGGATPMPQLADLEVATGTRAFQPMNIMRYKDPMFKNYPMGDKPTQWPPLWDASESSAYLYGNRHPSLQRPLTLQGPFKEGTVFRVHINNVSNFADVKLTADETTVFNVKFVAGPGKGDWKYSVYNMKLGFYQNIYDRDYDIAIPKDAEIVHISVGEGEWIKIDGIGITPPGKKEYVVQTFRSEFNLKPDVIYIDAQGKPDSRNKTKYSKDWGKQQYVDPWLDLQHKGVGVMVEEWGVYKNTPHDVTLSLMQDYLANWHDAGMGWALRDFRGPYGIIDSDRSDVKYEKFHGHKLDREMLTLLQKYN